jgi:hypothetical protein
MEAPPEDIRRAAKDEDKPDFDSWERPEDLVTGTRTRDDFLDVALQLREPTPISEIADRADRGEDAAREYMQFFESIGVVREFTGRPTRYQVNRNYLRWRRVDKLRNEYTQSELIERLTKMDEQIQEFREQFDVDSPADVSLTQHAERTGRGTEAVWMDLGEWKSAETRRALLEAALQPDDPLFDLDARLTA